MIDNISLITYISEPCLHHFIDCLYSLDLSHIMSKHVLNSSFQSLSTRWTTGATTFHLKLDETAIFVEANILDVAAVFLDEWSDPCLYNFFDELDCLRIIVVNERVFCW